MIASHLTTIVLLYQEHDPDDGLATGRNVLVKLLLLLLLSSSSSSSLLTAIQLSLGGSSPYTSTDKTNKNKYT